MANLDSVQLFDDLYQIKDKNVYTLIADEYDNTLTYSVGDCCIYDYKLYKCSTAVTAPEDFDSTKWEQKTLIEIIKNI